MRPGRRWSRLGFFRCLAEAGLYIELVRAASSLIMPNTCLNRPDLHPAHPDLPRSDALTGVLTIWTHNPPTPADGLHPNG